jgi:glycosyltransferase involved in cell wall biosynthesis
MKISIIIPCYNEEKNIKECIRQIPKMEWEYEIVVIDDGSTDKTAQVSRSIKQPNIKVISYEKNRGKGFALRAGLKEASGDIIVILDADYTSPPQDIPRLVKPIYEQKADFVNASRFMYPMEPAAMSRLHIVGNKIAALLISLHIGQGLTDSLCGLKAFSKKPLLGKLKENSWPDFELLLQAKKNNLRIIEVPIGYKARKAGLSKMKMPGAGLRIAILLLKSLIR